MFDLGEIGETAPMQFTRMTPYSVPIQRTKLENEIDHVLNYMKRHGRSLTREKYRELAYMGNPPAELSEEEESMLPEEFQERSDDDKDDLWVKLFHQ